MNEEKLYAMTGLFDMPDDIMHAASEAAKRYRKFDVHTPYPVHGMDDAMGLGESRIGWVTLLVGTTCMLLMLGFIAWVSFINYPNIWAGKPLFNLPAYIPILFETTILTGAVTTVIVLFTIVCGLPRNNHPLHDTAYMRRTSDDKFGLCIEASDDNFKSEDDAKAFLEELGAKEILAIHHDVKEASSGLSLTHPVFVSFLVLVVGLVSGGAYFALNRMVFMPPYDLMSKQERYSAQSVNTVFKDGRTHQMPVAGSVPRDYLPETMKDKMADAGKYLINPLPRNTQVLALGKQQYDAKCSACHGYYGKGDSRLNGQFPAGLTMHSDKVKKWADGNIYHVITYGQNVMPAYAKQLTKDERWAIIHYIRALQRSLSPKESDLK